MERKFHLLAISGSLRARSTNTELLHAVASIADPAVNVVIYDELGELPHFNPDRDLEGANLPDVVNDLRAFVDASDAILISSPEYAHGVPGSLKNALDWLVSGPEMVGKPAGLLCASGRSLYAHNSLAEILRTMSANLVDDAVDVIPLEGRRSDLAAILADDAARGTIERVVTALILAAKRPREFSSLRRIRSGTVLYRSVG
jgi:chromate reductase, NAD(P)H dehydrogenase (quinone)